MIDICGTVHGLITQTAICVSRATGEAARRLLLLVGARVPQNHRQDSLDQQGITSHLCEAF